MFCTTQLTSLKFSTYKTEINQKTCEINCMFQYEYKEQSRNAPPFCSRTQEYVTRKLYCDFHFLIYLRIDSSMCISMLYNIHYKPSILCLAYNFFSKMLEATQPLCFLHAALFKKKRKNNNIIHLKYFFKRGLTQS